MQHHATEPSTAVRAARPPAFQWGDIVRLQDTHAVRIEASGKRRGSWKHPHVRRVRKAIRLYQRDQTIARQESVSLYWLYEYLAHGGVITDRRLMDAHAYERARTALVSALNQPHSGLKVVRQRWTHYTA